MLRFFSLVKFTNVSHRYPTLTMLSVSNVVRVSSLISPSKVTFFVDSDILEDVHLKELIAPGGSGVGSLVAKYDYSLNSLAHHADLGLIFQKYSRVLKADWENMYTKQSRNPGCLAALIHKGTYR